MLRPLNTKKWDWNAAAHLLNRAGFGGTREDITRLHKMGLYKAVDHLVEWQKVKMPVETAPIEAPKKEDLEKIKELRKLPEKERRVQFQKVRRMQRQHLVNMRTWWLKRMVDSPRPLEEKMTLFWHGHFATSIQKVKNPWMMWNQQQTLRKHANGSFEQMTIDIGRDPAMLVFLDGARSKKKQPNENYARELMELFTLGEGNYSEDDIREAARAFTGWRVNRANGVARLVKNQVDNGRKKFRGKSGKFNDEDIVRLILDDDQCSMFITRKIWSFFGYENPDDKLIRQLAFTFRQNKFKIAPVLKQIFLSEEFYSVKAQRTQIKSPVQWLAHLYKTLHIQAEPGMMIQRAIAQLGQELYQPPSVKGWDGGRAWVSTSTLLFRYNMAKMIIYGGDLRQLGNVNNRSIKDFLNNAKKEGATMDPQMVERFEKMQGNKFNIPSLVQTHKVISSVASKDSKAAARELVQTFFAVNEFPEMEKTLLEYINKEGETVTVADIKGALYLMTTRPEFQLT